MQQLLSQPTPPAPTPPPAGPAHVWPTFTGRTARYALGYTILIVATIVTFWWIRGGLGG